MIDQIDWPEAAVLIVMCIGFLCFIGITETGRWPWERK